MADGGGGDVISELKVALKFIVEDKKLKDFIKSIGDLNMSTVLSALGLTGIAAAAEKVSEMADKAAMGVYNFGVQTGMAIEPMQQFSTFAEEMGAGKADVEAYTRSLQNLRIAYRQGNPGATYAVLRANLDPNQLDNLQYVNEKLHKFYKNEAIPNIDRLTVAQNLHGESLLGAYKASEDLWRSQYKLDVIHTKEAETIQKQHAAQALLNHEWDIAAVRLQVLIAPIMVKFLNLLIDILRYIADHKWAQWAIILGTTAVALMSLAVSLGAVAKGIALLNIAQFAGLVTGIRGLGIAFAFLGNAIAYTLLYFVEFAAVYKATRFVSEKSGLDNLLSGKKGLLTKMFETMDKGDASWYATHPAPNSSSSKSTVLNNHGVTHINVSGKGYTPEEIRRMAKEQNELDWLRRWTGDLGGQRI